MKKVLFFIPSLIGAGAERVLVNLVNHIDHSKFDITVMTLFAGGVNEKNLDPKIKYKSLFRKTFRGNCVFLRMFNPTFLHKMFIKESYDIEVAFLEGPGTRIISGCPYPDTKIVSWLHIELNNWKKLQHPYRNKSEVISCYSRFDANIAVSESSATSFKKIFNGQFPIQVLYNVQDTKKIVSLSHSNVPVLSTQNEFTILGMGRLVEHKGFMKLLKIHQQLLKNGFKVRTIIVGEGEQFEELNKFIKSNGLDSTAILAGFQENPYPWLKMADLYVCASELEGYSTTTVESLILGTPVVTTPVSGSYEILEGLSDFSIAKSCSEDDLFKKITELISDKKRYLDYKSRIKEITSKFELKTRVDELESFFDSL